MSEQEPIDIQPVSPPRSARAVMFSCGFLLGIIVTAAVTIPLLAGPSTKAAAQSLHMLNCSELSDTKEQWGSHHTRCLMAGEEWMCSAHGCERIPAVQ